MQLTQELRRSNKHLLFKSLSSEGSFLCSHVYPIQTLSKSEIFLSLDSFGPHMQNGNIILTPHRTVVSIPLMAALTETRQLRFIAVVILYKHPTILVCCSHLNALFHMIRLTHNTKLMKLHCKFKVSPSPWK